MPLHPPQKSPGHGVPAARGPAVVYCALTVALVALVAAIAFSAAPPAPPQIAQFAPQAHHQIQKAPNQLSSNLGSAGGGQGGNPTAGSTTTTTAAPGHAPGTAGLRPQILAPAAHHCFGNPPRQIQDTQSPPCVAYWQGNNGGATSMGVTGDTITVAINPSGSSTEASRVQADLLTFFNRYFELYGRRITFVSVGGGFGSNVCSNQQAEADGIAQQDQPFAILDGSIFYGPCFMEGAARDHMVIVGTYQFNTERQMASWSPYVWQYPMGTDLELESIGHLICDNLAGRKASYSPSPTINSRVRKFGIIIQESDDTGAFPVDVSPLENEMSSCGAPPVAVVTVPPSNAEQEQANAVIDMQSSGATTVLCWCEWGTEDGYPAAADSQAYYPEWIVTSWGNEDNYLVKQGWPDADQRKALMGMTAFPAELPAPDMTLNWALQAVDPGFQDSLGSNAIWDQNFYEGMLEIAAGIQMAGPDLTPQTFKNGLQQADFPNPFSPEMEGVASFEGGSLAMTRDVALMWWDDAVPDVYPEEGPGGWCYIDGGRRFSLAAWPSGPLPFFQGPCYTSPVTPQP